MGIRFDSRLVLVTLKCTTFLILVNSVFMKILKHEQIVKDLRSIGSKISVEDLENYQADKVEALKTALPGVDGYKIMTVPPPAGGVALIEILNILKGKFDL